MPWNDGLLPDQETAAGYSGTHARLLAGPGTGKTHVLTRRVVYLLTEEGVPPDELVALTFTRAAASELRERVAAELEEERGEIDEEELPRISTLHSFALRQLLRNAERVQQLPQPLRIADDWEERHVIQEDLKSVLDHDCISETQDLFKQLAADWQTMRAEDEDFTPDPAFIGAWREHRQLYGYTLRDELVYQLTRALRRDPGLDLETPIRHLLVDEYQDLNRCDLSLVRAMVERGAELFVAGDDDQSIYGFRKAEPDGIRDFTDEYDPSKNLPLELCLRCDSAILDLAQFVAELDPHRVPKRLRAQDGRTGGEVAVLRFDNQYSEAAAVARLCRTLVDAGHHPDGILILLRSDLYDAFSDPLVEQLRDADVPAASGSADGPLEKEGGELVMALLRLLDDTNDHLAWRTLVQERNNHLGAAALSALHEQCRANGEQLADALRRVAADPGTLARFGGAVRREVTAIEALLERAVGELGPEEPTADQLAAAARVLAEEVVDDADVIGEIVDHVRSVSREAAAASTEDLLRALAVADVEIDQPLEPGAVNILTMHQAKGLTAETVIVAGAEDERIPGHGTEEPALGDERRLLFVSLTRAKHRLFVTYCNDRLGRQSKFGRETDITDRTLTRFLVDAPVEPVDGNNLVYSYAPELEADTVGPES